MKHILALGIALLVLWLLLSGLYKPLFIGLGIASVALVIWITLRMDTADHEAVPLHLGPRALGYWGWLAREVARSNVDVARRVLSPSLPISPCAFEVRSSQRTALGQTIYANSITLTPGTVSMWLEGDRIRVHALTQDTRRALEGGEMDRRVADFEGDWQQAPRGPAAPEA